ncbi:MAG: hypothetical protein IT289_07990 [Oligoflexia bacterium]|nr:hypothetical protein [Oligoflexia bacterium]
MRKAKEPAVLLLVLFFLSGCAMYMSQTSDSQSAFYNGDFHRASDLLEAKSKEESKDQLLYLLDRAMALQLLGNFKESTQLFLKADKMTEVKDYTSISTEAATLITNDSIREYAGEDFEKVMINAMLAVNYTIARDFDEALVECRRVNHKLTKYKNEAKKDYEQNPFARYLAGMIWEASGKLDDAYIDYRFAYQINPHFKYVKRDLLRLGKRLGRTEDLKKWESEFGSEFGDVDPKPPKNHGEVIVIYQQGKSAVKRPRPENFRFPQFFSRPATTQFARLEVSEKSITELSQMVYSVSETAIKTLDDAYAGLVAKRAAGIAAKAVVADQLRQKNELLGTLAWIGMNAADQADTRHWSTLPDTLQIIRAWVPQGKQQIKIVGLDGSMNPTGEEFSGEIDVRSGKKYFLNWRSVK